MTLRGAEFLAIGSELLLPWRIDTNGSFAARCLGEIGVPLRFRTIVGDDPADLEDAFRTAIARSDLVIATGGLGPTVDDRTREAAAAVLGRPLREDPEILRGLEERFRRAGRDMPPRNRLQAQVIEGAVVLPNPVGTAPGQILRTGGSLVVLLPGVPSEMRPMLRDSLLPRLPRTGERFAYRVLKIAGLPESEVDRRLAEAHRSAGEIDWTILAAPEQIEIHLRERIAEGEGPRGIARVEEAIDRALGVHLFARDEETMEEIAGRLLLSTGATVATAESLTGGAIARRLTAVPGASRYFAGGVVCYSEAAKERLAGVRPATLAARGPVSAETAREMAQGVRRLLGTTWAIAATGYAGPEGGADGTPPGTVFLALAGPVGGREERLRLPGDRAFVRARAAMGGLDLLRRALLGRTGPRDAGAAGGGAG